MITYTIKRVITRIISATVLLLILYTGNVFGQTGIGFPVCTKNNGTTFLPNCVSQDLQAVGAFLTANQCYCSAGDSTPTTLHMVLFNKTGSTRTSFAFYADLVETNPVTHTSTTKFITGCTGPVSPNTNDTVTFSGTYKFVCGDSLVLTNVWLAWTDASDNRQCPLAFCAISPKCGTSGNIVITPLLTAIKSSDASCQNASTGSVSISPKGGTAPYTVTINGTNYTVSAGGTATATGLAAGVYSVTVKDHVNCTLTLADTVGSKVCCVAPAKPTITATSAGICSNGTVSLTICNAVVGDSYYFVRGTTRDTIKALATTITFNNISPSTTDFYVFGIDTVNGTSCVSDTARCTDLQSTCPSPGVPSPNVQNIQLAPSQTSVIAAPNPFNDRIRFTLQSKVSGQGTLELYNMLGQKVKVVYQGYMQQGQVQTVEYSVPMYQRSNLIYLFRVGNEQTSGKLIGLKQ